MKNPAATLYCSNPNCQAPNLESHNFCQQCRTPLAKRYLWAMGEGIEAYKTGSLIAERYLHKSDSLRDSFAYRIVLDTRPGLLPQMPPEIPNSLIPYLKLSSYQLHVPQVYGQITSGEGRRNSEIWLLENSPIYTTGNVEGQLMPELVSVWKNASAMSQLSFLWQMASLWSPLQSNRVASTLLTPKLLRIEGSIFRLLELRDDQNQPATLQKLGQLWSQWVSSAHPTVASFLAQVCQELVEGTIPSSDQLVVHLESGLAKIGRSLSYSYQIVTRTDTGPIRKQNEDSCYPPSPGSQETQEHPLAIVCDGIGGHEGGEVASNLAIETIRERVEHLLENPNNINPTTINLELESFACAANDVISQRNDLEQRQDRQRMGTTLVMALAHAHEMYISHVGDSRAYWITRTGCRQVTLDDDIASREVRLGYSLYRAAVEQAGAGSLVQALGMGSSLMLHPTVQRFVLDEDSIFLLCSDGLSDNDRVEQYWETEILPVLEGQIDLATAGSRLMEIANTQNGHDNTTIGLVYCQVREAQAGQSATALQMAAIPEPEAGGTRNLASPQAASSRIKTKIIPQRSSSGSPLLTLLMLLILAGLGGAIAYWFLPEVQAWVNPLIGLDSTPAPTATTPTTIPKSTEPPVTSPTPAADIEAGTIVQINSFTTRNSQDNEVPVLLRRGTQQPQNESVNGIILPGSVLQVSSIQRNGNLDTWLQVQVCSTPATPEPPVPSPKVNAGTQKPPAAPEPKKQPPGVVWQPSQTTGSKSPVITYRPVKQGDLGWIRESEFTPVLVQNFTATSSNLGECAIKTASPTPATTASPPP